MTTTPLEREILTHYYTRPGPYLGGSENWTDLISTIVNGFCLAGVLIQRYDSETGLHSIEGNKEALEVYMEALGRVPLPERRWCVPSEWYVNSQRRNSG